MEASIVFSPNFETQSPPMMKTKSPSNSIPRSNPVNNNSVVKPPVSPTKAQHSNYLSRMVIECDQKFNSSDGDLTFDESLAHEDNNYGSTQRNYHIPKDVGQKEMKAQPTFQSPPQVPSRTSSMQSYRSQSTSSNSIPVSPGMSLEEEEMRQLELAMERSLQDYNSCASNGNGSIVSERSYSNTIGSRYSSSGGRNRNLSSEGNNMTGAGCHLSMVPSSHRGNHTKSPSQTHHRVDGLHAIVEELEASNRSMSYMGNQSQSYRDDQFSKINIDPNLAIARIRELEREKALLEKCLQQNSNRPVVDTEIHFQPPSNMPVRPSIASQHSINSMNTNEIFVRRNPVKSASVRVNDAVPSAGCHLQMYAARSQSTRHLNDSSSGKSLNDYHYSSNTNNNNNNSSQSTNNTTDTKMVWKRGPNGAWGRFLDDGIDYNSSSNNNNSNNHSGQLHVAVEDDEDAQIAEALRRSLQQM